MTRLNPTYGLPPAQGLYDPAHEHDACGIGFVASISGHKSHDIIRKGIQILINLTHRGACGCDPETGDGAGVLIQIPHEFFARECAKLGFSLPEPGTYGVGMMFLPVEKHPAPAVRRHSRADRPRRRADRSGLARYAGRWRRHRPRGARFAALHRADFRGRRAPDMDEDAFERKLYVVRKRAENEIARVRASKTRRSSTFRRSPAARSSTRDCCWRRRSRISTENSPIPMPISALCLVHQRFSTNTFPSWQLAHPYRYVCPQRRNQHGARQCQLDARAAVDARSRRCSATISRSCFRSLRPDGSDSASFDNAVELLTAGRTQPAARDGHADSGSVGRQSAHEAGEARVLRISRLADGAVGRSGGDRLHRWPRDRRDARPQRPASRALRGHQGRPGGHGVGSRRAAHRAGRRQVQRPPAARQDVPGGHGRRPHHFRRGNQAAAGVAAALRAVAEGKSDHARSAARAVARARIRSRDDSAAASAPSATPTKICG